jgi:hypothetical protein
MKNVNHPLPFALIVLVVATVTLLGSDCQAPVFRLMQTYGDPYNDWGYDVLPLDDGGTLVVGRANNTYYSHMVMPGDARLLRTDSQGDLLWQRDYGDGNGRLYNIIRVGEDQYVALGNYAESAVGIDSDLFLIKVDGRGNEIWSHTYGGGGADCGGAVRQTSDGGFILLGALYDDFATGDLFLGHLYVIKTDAAGNCTWERSYGDGLLYLGFGIEETPDGGYVFSGWWAKTHDDRDFIVIKIDSVGNVEWERTWDPTPGDGDCAYDMLLTSDGHVVLAGIQSMYEGPRLATLVKLDLEGDEVWVKSYPRVDGETEFWDILEDEDGGYLMAGGLVGERNPATGEAPRQGLVVKTDADGEVLWETTLGDSEFDMIHFSAAAIHPDGGYVLTGQARREGERYDDMLWVRLVCDEGE